MYNCHICAHIIYIYIYIDNEADNMLHKYLSSWLPAICSNNIQDKRISLNDTKQKYF